MDWCCHGPKRCWNDTRMKRWKVFNSIFTRLKISHRNPTLAMKNWSYHQVPWEAMLYGFIHSFIFKVFHSFMFRAQSILLLLENYLFIYDWALTINLTPAPLIPLLLLHLIDVWVWGSNSSFAFLIWQSRWMVLSL